MLMLFYNGRMTELYFIKLANNRKLEATSGIGFFACKTGHLYPKYSIFCQNIYYGVNYMAELKINDYLEHMN